MLTQNNALHIWLQANLPNDDFSVNKLAGDASFRQYYRVQYANQSRIIMDSSADISAFNAFLDTTKLLAAANLPVPEIYATDNQNGFALITDFGDNFLLVEANSPSQKHIYKQAIDILLKLNKLSRPKACLPKFDADFMQQQMQLMDKWFLDEYLKLNITAAEKKLISATQAQIITNLQQQPQKITLMDYHSRNIIMQPNASLGIIDYQDACMAPYTYDLVSLLKDCYIQLPHQTIDDLLEYFYVKAAVKSASLQEFKHDFAICGLQRHIKVLGIFSRLGIRDNKITFFHDIPLTLNYVLDCIESYPEFSDFYFFMHNKVATALENKQRHDIGSGTR